MEDYTVIGFTEILSKIPAHYRLLRVLRRLFAARHYDLVILVDYPGFHLRVAESAKRAGLPVLYYIAPQLWAWRPQRAARFRTAVDRFAVIFPFEAPFFRSHGLDAVYVGHPLMDRPPGPSREGARAAIGLSTGARVLALFPGSRRQEVERHWLAFRDAAKGLLASGRVDQVVVATIAGARYPDPGSLVLRPADPASVLAAADVALVKSGTTVLEAAIADLPMVVAYRVHPTTAWFARRMMRVQWISLVNLIASAPVVEEVLQDSVTAERLAMAVGPLLDPSHPATEAQRVGLARVRQLLGGGGAAERVAELAAELLQ
jgi:lipid-A-disaccharide synthase